MQQMSVHLTFEGLTKLLVPITVQEGDLYLNMKIPGKISVLVVGLMI